MVERSFLEKIDDLNLEERDVLIDQSTDAGTMIDPTIVDPQMNQHNTLDRPFSGSTRDFASIASHDSSNYSGHTNITSEHSRPIPKTESWLTLTLRRVSSLPSVGYREVNFQFANLPWRLLINTECSERTDKRKFISVYIQCNPECDSILWSCDVQLKFSLLSRDSKREKFFAKLKYGKAMGIVRFVEWSQLMDPKNEYLNNDEATIEFQITFKTLIGFRSYFEYDFASISGPVSKSDVVLVVDGQPLCVCKQYLSIYSPVFHAMFFSEFSERDQNEIKLEDVKLSEFLEMLHAIYPTHKPVTKDNFEILLKLGDRFDVQFLIEECERFLITTKDVCISKKLVYADQYCLAKVQDVCMKTIKTISDLKMLKQQEDYKQFSSETKAALLERLLKNK